MKTARCTVGFSATSAPFGFTAVPGSVGIVGKILLVGFLHPSFPDAGKGSGREVSWYTMCLRADVGPRFREESCVPRSYDEFTLTKRMLNQNAYLLI